MTELRSISVGETNKLDGASNYHVWGLRMRAIFRREKWWVITENKIEPLVFPATIGGIKVENLNALNEMKASAMAAIIASVKDDVVDLITEYEDPAEAWEALRRTYHSQDASNSPMYQSQLHSLRMLEGGEMEEYLRKARELKNKLAALGDPVADKTLVQIVLNGLPRSYEFIIPSLTYAPVFPTFDVVCSKLITEYHRIQHRNKLLGDDDEALAVSFINNLNLQSTGGRGRSGPAYKGRRMIPSHGGPLGMYPQGRHIDFRGRATTTRGRSTTIHPRGTPHQDVCWVCGKAGHLARECWHRYGQSSSSINLVEGIETDVETEQVELEVAFTEFQENLDTSSKWYMDSGVSRHVTGVRENLESLISPVERRTVTTADGERHAVGWQW